MTLPLPFALRPVSLTGLGLVLLLAGCATLNGLIGTARVGVLGGAVTVAAPSGYCVGPGEVQEADDTAVVLIGRCIATGLVDPAVISVSVGRAASAGVMVAGNEALAAFFATEQGRSLLARSGRSGDVTLVETRAQDQALLLLLDDAEAGRYWRAVSGLNGRLVTISAQGTGGVALDPAASLRAVEQTLRAMQAANPPRLAVEPVLLPDGATQRPPARPGP